jgi:DNA-binding winged helix-turn-helix (wHTH) protein
LRRKLSACRERLVINVWGIGYRFCDPPAYQQPTGDTAMSPRDPHPALATQPTCRHRPSSTTTGPSSSALEISHASRLRRKLRSHGDELLMNVWGVGYRLVDVLPSRRGWAA